MYVVDSCMTQIILTFLDCCVAVKQCLKPKDLAWTRWLLVSVAFGKLLVNEFRSCFKGYFHGKQNNVRSEQFSPSVISCILSANAMTCSKNATMLSGQS